MLFEPQDTPPHLALSGDALKRLAAILRHAARLRQIGPIAVDEVLVTYAGTQWRITVDDQEDEVWTDAVTGVRRYGHDLTSNEAGD